MRLVHKTKISKTDKGYAKLVELSKTANNLYNQANYIIRQNFIFNVTNDGNRKYLNYNAMDKLAKKHEWENYLNLPAQSAQQLLRQLDKNWKSFFAAIKDWKMNPDKYLSRPKPPKYCKKGGLHQVIFTAQQAKIKGSKIHFPKVLNGLTLEWNKTGKVCEIRMLPMGNHFVAEIVYKVVEAVLKPDNNRYASIDLGLNNLAAVSFSDGSTPIIINGKPLKSINNYYNKKIADAKSELEKTQNKKKSNYIDTLWKKRGNIMRDKMHKASRKIVNYLVSRNINTLVVGHNKLQKQGTTFQGLEDFVQVPIFELIKLLKYKCALVGITVIETEEQYTSGTSFLDNEQPTEPNYNKSRRRKRGLFVSNEKIAINADVNSAYQILNKVYNVEYNSSKLIFMPKKINLQ